MFEETQSANQFASQDVSNVDLIQSEEVTVTSVVTVADTKSKKLNINTITLQLSKIDQRQVETTAPIHFKELFAEFERVASLYKQVVANL